MNTDMWVIWIITIFFVLAIIPKLVIYIVRFVVFFSDVVFKVKISLFGAAKSKDLKEALVYMLISTVLFVLVGTAIIFVLNFAPILIGLLFYTFTNTMNAFVQYYHLQNEMIQLSIVLVLLAVIGSVVGISVWRLDSKVEGDETNEK